MPATEYQGSSTPLTNIGRSILSVRRDQIQMDGSHDPLAQGKELQNFQNQVFEQFSWLSSANSDEILSLSWIRNLLDVFICCQEEFRIVLLNNKSYLGRSPMDRLIGEFYERSVKALDVCNAIRDGVEQIRQWHKLLEIVLLALGNDQQTIGEGQIRRAKKAMIDLAIGMLDEKESTAALSHRNRSFGRNNGSNKDNKNLGHFRSLSWSVSRSWSASRQLQVMGNSMNCPKGNEIMATNGLAMSVYTISCVLYLVMWALVAAIPCQDRGLQSHFSIPRHLLWAPSMMSIHDKIMEESKKKVRKNACGLLGEIYVIDKWGRQMNEVLDSLQFPLVEEKEVEVRQKVEELRKVFEALKEGLDPLERQVREVFHRIVRSRTEGLDVIGRGSNAD